MKRTLFTLVCLLFFVRPAAIAQAPLPQRPVAQTLAEKRRVAWFEDARFGLFIHWGLYAVPAGEWQGKTDYGEWIMMSTRMPASEYAHFAGQFAPTHFDPNACVISCEQQNLIKTRSGFRRCVI